MAVSPPGEPVALGDIYTINDGVPERVGKLADWGIPFDQEPDVGVRGNWSAKSKSGVDVVVKIKGKTPEGVVLQELGSADAGVVVKFSGKDGFLLALKDVQFHRMSDTRALEAPLRKAFAHLIGGWNTKWLIVSEVAEAGSGTFLSSSSDNSQVELKADADIKADAISVADVAAGFSFAGVHAGSNEFVSRGSITPIFRAVKLTFTGAVGPGGVERLRAMDEVPEEQQSVEVVPMQDSDLD